MSADRYQIRQGSQSCHCCFDYTVVDTSKPDMVAGKQWMGSDGKTPQFESVCECFEEADAVAICEALNLREKSRAEAQR